MGASRELRRRRRGEHCVSVMPHAFSACYFERGSIENAGHGTLVRGGLPRLHWRHACMADLRRRRHAVVSQG